MGPTATSGAAAAERPVPRFLVSGGGPEAVRLALELADGGLPVTIATRGVIAPAAAGARGSTLADEVPLIVALRSHPGVQLLEGAEAVALAADPDGVEARLRLRPQPVDPTRCTACGKCVPVCPVELPAPRGRSPRRAVELPPPELGPAAARIAKEGRPPCRAACPIGVNAQGYVALVARGRFREALALVRDRNPLPGICGRVCTHPCETACRRGELDEPVSICRIKRFVADAELAAGTPFAYDPPATERPERVAVVGSGPAGLTAAFDLRRRGYRVTVFEAGAAPGGLLRTGIPEYRLPKAILDREIGLIAALGVEIRTGERIGAGRAVDDLLGEGYAAVVLATGSARDRRLGLPGEEHGGVVGCLAFLARASRGEDAAVGRRVVVVGGGNAGIDAARTALRLGAKEVTVLECLCEEEMPALPEELDAARAEGVRFELLTMPVAFLGEGGRVSAARCVRTELGDPDASGRRRPVPVAGSEHEVPADTVVIAVGQEADDAVAAGARGVSSRAGRILCDGHGRTGNPRVFVAGDAAREPASVIWAMADGQRAALAAHAAVSGEAVPWPDWSRTDYDRSVPPREGFRKAARRRVPHLPMPKRRSSFGEVELVFREQDAVAEASRCLQCGGCCECGACVSACGEARAIDHDRGAAELALPLLGAARLDPSEPLTEGAAHLFHDAAAGGPGGAALAAEIIRRFGGDHPLPARAIPASLRAPSPPPAAPSTAVFLCTCNGSVLRPDDVETLAAETATLPGVRSVRVLNAACQPEGAAAMASAPAGGADRVLLAACLCCSLGVVCSSCTHQRARCKENLLVAEGFRPGAFEAVNLRDEVLNQPGLSTGEALRLGRRAVRGGLARALAAPPPGAAPAPAAGPREVEPRRAPVPLPGLVPAAAHVDGALCRGCGTCVRACPQEAIALAPREGGVALARVEPGRCTLCGTCLAVCPTGAPDAPFESHAQLRAALGAALAGEVTA